MIIFTINYKYYHHYYCL